MYTPTAWQANTLKNMNTDSNLTLECCNTRQIKRKETYYGECRRPFRTLESVCLIQIKYDGIEKLNVSHHVKNAGDFVDMI